MPWQSPTWFRPADAAAGALIILALGSLAVFLSRQPARRARLAVLTILGGMAVPWLGALPIAPRWSAGLLPPPPATSPRIEPEAPAEAIVRSPGRGATGSTAFAEPVEAPSGMARPLAVSLTPPPTEPPREQRWSLPPASTWLLWGYVIVSAGLAAWWLAGQVVLRRVTRSARPVPASVRDLFLGLAGAGGMRVVLLESDRIASPFTYTWARPVILLPSRFCDPGEPAALRYILAHEWSHVDRRDARAWNLACLAGLVLFYQPLFWWLRRQLRLSQDYLADAQAAAAGSAEDYAAFLIRLARARESGPELPALGIGDRRSNLTRRVMMLVQDHEPLERRCRLVWSLTAASASIAAIFIVSGLRLDAAPPETPSKEVKAVKDAAKAPTPPERAGETLHYKGTVLDKDTGKPIAGVNVVVRRSILKDQDNRVLQETHHTTAADGTYSFVIPPEQVAQSYLYIELDVEHPDYATRAGFGYALGMTRKNEKLNERPFFETIELRPAKPITGRIETPEGSPAAGVSILAYSVTDKVAKGEFEYGSFARARTDAEGKFRMPITTPGRAVYWILPETYAPEMHGLPDNKRGDLGTITLKKGIIVKGRAFDVQGKPLAKMLVKADRERGSGPEFEALNNLPVADAVERTAETDAEGGFAFGPLPPGNYRVVPTDFDPRGDRSAGRVRREIPGVFAPKKLTIKEGESPAPLEVRASPVVVIEGQWLDSKGKPKSGWGSSVFGRIDGTFWQGTAKIDSEGKFSLKVPHGLEQVELDIMTNEHASTRHRMTKEGPLVEGRLVKLGTLDHDVKGIEIVRYTAPIVIIDAKTKDGQRVKDFKATAEYTKPNPNKDSDRGVYVVGGGKRKSIQDEQYDGRYRTSQLVPDREVKFTASADGFKSASRVLSLTEGKTEEVTLVLEPK